MASTGGGVDVNIPIGKQTGSSGSAPQSVPQSTVGSAITVYMYVRGGEDTADIRLPMGTARSHHAAERLVVGSYQNHHIKAWDIEDPRRRTKTMVQRDTVGGLLRTEFKL